MFIENEAAYEAAIDRNIRENRRKGGEKRFRAAFEDAQAIIDFVEARVSDAQVEFYAKWGRALEDASFIDACYAGLKTFGGLTEKQALAVRNIIAKNAERKSAYRAEALTKVHVGTVGERREFTLTVVHVHAFEGQFGYVFINILNDAEGNVVVYKGSKELGEKGTTLTLKATVKEHGERDGVKQTIIARPSQK
jgi:methyl coenzyme M reductase beta subunit